MKYLISVVFAAVVFTGIAFAATHGQSADRDTLRAVIHVNYDDGRRQEMTLKNVDNILQQDANAQLEVVCHGEGITLLKKDSKAADHISELTKKGVRFAACENTMKKKSLKKDDLLTEVVTVPSGVVEVIRKQQEGYSYLRP